MSSQGGKVHEKIRSAYCMHMLLRCSRSCREGVWVDETWREVKRQVDCDGLPLVIDARVLQVAEDAMGQEYHTQALSNAWMEEKMKAVDWSQLGCDTSSGSWRQPTNDWPEYKYINGERIFPTFGVLAGNRFLFQKCDCEYAYWLSAPIQSRWTCRPSAR